MTNYNREIFQSGAVDRQAIDCAIQENMSPEGVTTTIAFLRICSGYHMTNAAGRRTKLKVEAGQHADRDAGGRGIRPPPRKDRSVANFDCTRHDARLPREFTLILRFSHPFPVSPMIDDSAETQSTGQLNPLALSPANAARLLSKAGGRRLPIEQIEADIEVGCPHGD